MSQNARSPVRSGRCDGGGSERLGVSPGAALVDVGVEGRAAHTKVTAFTPQLSPTEPDANRELQASQAFLAHPALGQHLWGAADPKTARTQHPQGPPANRWRGTARARTHTRRPCSRPAHRPGPPCSRPGVSARSPPVPGHASPRPAPAFSPSAPGRPRAPAAERQRGERLRGTCPGREEGRGSVAGDGSPPGEEGQ